MRRFRLLVLATTAAGGVLLAPARADAHAMHTKVEVGAAEVKLLAYFDEDLPADFAEVVVADAAGAAVLTGKTDARGVWTFLPPKPGDYRLTVKHEQTGHTTRVKFTVPGEPDAAPAVFTGAWVSKPLGLVIGLGGLLGLSAVYWFVLRARRVR